VSDSTKSEGFEPVIAILVKASAPVPLLLAWILWLGPEVPESWFPKLMLERLNETSGCVAVPDSGTVSGLPVP
jgi:hypothetical protein